MSEYSSEPLMEETAATRHEQDQKIANLIEQAGTLIGSIQKDPVALQKLGEMGYDNARFEEGFALQVEALRRFTERAQAIGSQRRATNLLNESDTGAREEYALFRLVVRTLFTKAEDASNLSLKDDISPDRQIFTTTAQASYTAAMQEPYTSRLAAYGYSQEKLDKLLQDIQAMEATDEDQNAAISAAVAATAARDQVADGLREYVRRLRTMLKAALKDDPERLSLLQI